MAMNVYRSCVPCGCEKPCLASATNITRAGLPLYRIHPSIHPSGRAGGNCGCLVTLWLADEPPSATSGTLSGTWSRGCASKIRDGWDWPSLGLGVDSVGGGRGRKVATQHSDINPQDHP